MPAKSGLTQNFIYVDEGGIERIPAVQAFVHRNTHTVIQILVITNIELMPVVKSRTFELLVGL